jgi:hypothetical protein
MALARPHGLTVEDLWTVADTLRTDADRIIAGGAR